jgi:hypothetical protein
MHAITGSQRHPHTRDTVAVPGDNFFMKSGVLYAKDPANETRLRYFIVFSVTTQVGST